MLGDTLSDPIVAVDILDPYSEREFLNDKLSIVDVKARDDRQRLFQIEIQVINLPELPARILYGWADLYSAQLGDGASYAQLRPTYALWLLRRTLRPDITDGIHRFQLRDDAGRTLLDHGGIWLFELRKLKIETVTSERDRWLKFFIEGERLETDRLPAWMQTPEMQQAMTTLRRFSDKERNYHAYQARQTYLRDQESLQRHLESVEAARKQAIAATEQALATKDQALADKDQALADKDQALAELARERAEKEQMLAELTRLRARQSDLN